MTQQTIRKTRNDTDIPRTEVERLHISNGAKARWEKYRREMTKTMTMKNQSIRELEEEMSHTHILGLDRMDKASREEQDWMRNFTWESLEDE